MVKGNLHIFSFGGCGTRMFYNWLKNKYKTITDQQTVHHGWPPNRIDKNDRVIYLFGDPVKSVTSFYGKHYENNVFIKYHALNLKIPVPTFNIDEYIKSGVDQFKLIEHFNRYKKMENCILINYDYLWDELPKILDYLNLSNHIDDFPIKKCRNPKPFINEEKSKEIEKMYKDTNEEMKKIRIKIQ